MRTEDDREITLGEAGERTVLKRVLAQLGDARAVVLGAGDDCAVLDVGGDLVVTSDTMIEGPDFRLDWHTGVELGRKLAATNLSDVAAMGARPIGLTASLAAPRDTPVRLFEEIARGLDAACRELAPGCGVVGGDLGRAPVLVAAITALGDLEGRAPVTRAGARPGDAVCYAGQLGLSGLGLSRLFAVGAEKARISDPVAVAAQFAPVPPVLLGVSASEAGARAMLDVSDGLALDAARLAEASGVGVDLDASLLERGFSVQDGAAVPLEAMLYGGEDHGLLAAFPPESKPPAGFTEIGAIRAGSGVTLDGALLAARGWDPYSPTGG